MSPCTDRIVTANYVWIASLIVRGFETMIPRSQRHLSPTTVAKIVLTIWPGPIRQKRISTSWTEQRTAQHSEPVRVGIVTTGLLTTGTGVWILLSYGIWNMSTCTGSRITANYERLDYASLVVRGFVTMVPRSQRQLSPQRWQIENPNRSHSQTASCQGTFVTSQ